MTIIIQKEVWSILIITVGICIFCVVAGLKLKNSDPSKAPTGIANVGLIVVNFFEKLVTDNMGKEYVNFLAPIVAALGLFILPANLIGLLSLPNPTANFSVTLTLALIAWVIIEGTQIKEKGVKDFLKGFLDPIFIFLPMNLFGELSPLLSMSMRLFGNILVGGVLMSLVYTFTGFVSSLIPFVGKFNFIGPIVAPVLHAYFDLFAGTIQTYIFIMLTTALAKSKAES